MTRYTLVGLGLLAVLLGFALVEWPLFLALACVCSPLVALLAIGAHFDRLTDQRLERLERMARFKPYDHTHPGTWGE